MRIFKACVIATIATLLSPSAYAVTIQCLTGADISRAVSDMLQLGSPVDLDAENGNLCEAFESINGTGGVLPVIHGNGANLSAHTGGYPVLDFTQSGFAVVDNLHITSNAPNPSIYGMRLGPDNRCQSNVGQATITGVSFCMVPGCDYQQRGNGSIGIDIDRAEQNFFYNVSWDQADTPVEIVGDTVNDDTPPIMPSQYSLLGVCAGRHSSIGNFFFGGQLAAMETSDIVTRGEVRNLLVLGTLLSAPSDNFAVESTPFSITLNGPLYDSAIIAPRVERFTQLLDLNGWKAKNSVFAGSAVPLGRHVKSGRKFKLDIMLPTTMR